jgi:osmotically inducible protein OsmC
MALPAVEKPSALKGHGFSRADKVRKIDGALAPEERRTESSKLVQSFHPANGRHSITPKEGSMASKASAVWTGSLKEGKGTISTATGVLSNANYSFASRFEGAATGTTPEEMIAAAHAACYSMALGGQLGAAGLTPTKIETHAAVSLGKVEGGFAINRITLTTTASVPGATKAVFDKAAAEAKDGCPISKLFAGNTTIVLDAKLV